MSNLNDIKKGLKEEKIIMGTTKAIKELKLGRLSKVYVTSNCPNSVKEDIEHYSKIANVEVIKLTIANDALGTVCKKPFSISVLGFIKG